MFTPCFRSAVMQEQSDPYLLPLAQIIPPENVGTDKPEKGSLCLGYLFS